MKLTAQEKQTIDAYNTHANQWAQSRRSLGKWSKENEKNTFQSYLPNGKILEIGSGGGWDAQELIKAGYDYTGTDISEGLLT